MPTKLLPRLFSQINWFARRAGRFALTAVRFPGVVQVLTLAVLYRIAERKWCEKYCGVWEPGFPRAWTVFVLVLSILPVFALLQLLWLVCSTLVVNAINKRNKKRHGSSSGIVFNTEEAARMLRDDEEGEDTPTSPTSKTPRSKVWSRVPSFALVAKWAQVVFYTWLLYVGIREFRHYEQEDDIRFRPALQKALAHTNRDPNGYAKGEKIYFAAAFYNNQDVLPYWTNTLLDVIAYLGPNNVYVSVVENNSDDRTAELLRELDSKLAKLNVARRIIIQDDTIKKPDDMSWNNRIDFLATIRNRALEPLVQNGGYDRVVFSNDIFIEPESLIELIETADGNYDMACALDFGHFGAYDMWVLRDRIGHLAAGIWPYFFDGADYEAMKTGSPAPVFSCWNGIVVFSADPVIPVHLRSNRTLSHDALAHYPPPTHPLAGTVAESPALTPPITFRSSPRGEGCYSSESFLLPYDMRRIMGMERIFVNPRVITAYVWHFYVWHKWVLRHRIVRWFVETQYDGAWMQYARMIVGDKEKVYTWDGGDCHPWWYGDTW